MGSRAKTIPGEALLSLRRRLENMPARDPERRQAIQQTAATFGLSEWSVYRALRNLHRPKGLRRADRGEPRKIPKAELERYCEVIAALKIRTSNLKGRHLSTNRAIELLEEHGVETPNGLVQVPSGELSRSTVNRYLRLWGYDHARMTRAPAAVRFEARQSNELWQFDISPSDLKEVEQPLWIEPGRKAPTLMLFSVVDDRSGVSYQEYRCVYGEDVESGLRFLFNAMALKEGPGLQGIPAAIYLDNGPIARSGVFQMVMERLGIRVMTHLPAGKDGRRPTARSKGKVERPFRTVKEAHETLYHFHKPKTEEEANLWLRHFLERYNDKRHRREAHSRMEDWIQNLPEAGVREMCSWERFCAFAREPERRKVGGDARVQVEGVAYEVASELAGEEVMLWWGLFDHELFVELGDKRFGPYRPVGGPIPLHRYRKHKKSAAEKRADSIAELAEKISLSKEALSGKPDVAAAAAVLPFAQQPFVDPDPYRQFTYVSRLDALRGVSDILQRPLARLDEKDLQFVNDLVAGTLDKAEIKSAVTARFKRRST